MDLVRKYFPSLDRRQEWQFERLLEVIPSLNRKVNIISRKDMQHLEERHILHSLAIAKQFEFGRDTSVIDAGTGGGFPGIPLAILFPDARFILVDSIGKKIRMVMEICQILELKNTRSFQARVEKLELTADYVVSRAVTAFPRLVRWTDHLIRARGEDHRAASENTGAGRNSSKAAGISHSTTGDSRSTAVGSHYAGGLIALKGGDLEKELGRFMKQVELYPISAWFNEPFFSTKAIVYLKK